MNEFQTPPGVTAAADQEIAMLNEVVDRLIAKWKNDQAFFDEAGLDEQERIALFMYTHCVRLRYPGGLIGIMVERLSRA